jgi:hypothetical protein
VNNQPNTIVAKMEARSLEIHPRAQRRVNQARLKELRENFDLDVVGAIHAVQKVIDGKVHTYVVDGQHRVKTLLALGLGEWQVTVLIHSDVTTDARAAELFLDLNHCTNVSCYSKFQNELVACHSPAVEITRLVEARGLKISTYPGDGLVRCVNALKAAYAHDSGSSLINALDCILAAWGQCAAGLDGHVIEGLAQVYATFTDAVDTPSMIRRLGQYPGGATGILGAARGMRVFRRQPVAACVAEVIVDAYNAKRTTRRLERVEYQEVRKQEARRGRA